MSHSRPPHALRGGLAGARRPRAPRAGKSDASELWTNRRHVGPDPVQTRERTACIVGPEGGGTVHPTLGGGCWVMAAAAAIRGVVVS